MKYLLFLVLFYSLIDTWGKTETQAGKGLVPGHRACWWQHVGVGLRVGKQLKW